MGVSRTAIRTATNLARRASSLLEMCHVTLFTSRNSGNMAASSCDVRERRMWLSWGANSYGQLGHGHQNDLSLPHRIADMPSNVTHISGGGGHTLFKTADGRCYACGWNHKGQLGVGSELQEKELTFPKPVSQQHISDDIIKVAAGWDHSMIISSSGSLYSFGSNMYGQLGIGKNVIYSATPELVSGQEEPTLDMACGMRHSIILTANDVFTCGFGKRGQLGQCSPDGMPVNKADYFEKVILPRNCGRIIQVAAGANHSAAVTDTGQLIVWGDNKHGQLAMDPDVTPQQPLPIIVPRSLFDDHKIIRVYTGWTHMLAVTDGGLVYAWGRSNYGQLGRTTSSKENPEFCHWQPHSLGITNPKKIACGAEHNLLLSDKNELFSWGWNEHGMCGTGDNDDVLEPQKVTFFAGQKVTDISCGSGHSFAQIENVL